MLSNLEDYYDSDFPDFITFVKISYIFPQKFS